MEKLDIKVKQTEETTYTDADVSQEVLDGLALPKPIKSKSVEQAQPELAAAAKLYKKDMASMTDEELLDFLDGKGISNKETIYPSTHSSVQAELTRRAIHKASRPNVYSKISLVLAIVSLVISVASSWPDLKGYLGLLAGSEPSAQVNALAQEAVSDQHKTQNVKPKE